MHFHQTVASILILPMTLALAASAFAAERPYPEDWYWGDASQQAKHAQMEGKPAPALALSEWMNGEVTAEDMAGKIVVVDFWATWCGPCIRSIPHNNEIASEYADQGVLVIGVCGSGSGQDKMAETANKHDIQYPIAKDATQESAKAWQVMWWPTYGVIDRQGTLRALGLKPSAVDKVVEKLIEEQPLAQDDDAQAAVEQDMQEAGFVPVSQAEAPNAFLEGDEAKRARLKGLEANADQPPALVAHGWLNSEALTLDQLQGKVVVLDFWATWCGPCIRSIPKNNELAEKYGDKLTLIGLCSPKGGEKMSSVVEQHGIQYPVAIDTDGKTNDAYEVNGYPDYYIIDTNGRLWAADVRNSKVAEAVAALLDE